MKQTMLGLSSEVLLVVGAGAATIAAYLLKRKPTDVNTKEIITLAPEHEEKFKKLDYWQQWDVISSVATEPDANPVKIMLHFVGGFLCAINVAIVYALTCWAFPGPSFYPTFVKNLIAWDSLARQHGFESAIHMLVQNFGCRVKWKPGTIKFGNFGWSAMRRTRLDVAITILFTLSRLYLIASPTPTSICAWLYLGATVLLAWTDFGQFTAIYGMLHGPWAVFLHAHYTGVPGAIALLQVALFTMYVNCGLGKMGPWFTQVFNQEWTLPPWAKIFDLRPLLYGPNFPTDVTPSRVGITLAYVAACVEWIAPFGWLLPASALGGLQLSSLPLVGPSLIGSSFVGSASPAVALATCSLVAMHAYIVGHMPALDVWLLNLTPAVLTPYAFHFASGLTEAGFNYGAFTMLPLPYKVACAASVGYTIFGQLRPEMVTYFYAYRFWAGNWPQGYTFLRSSAREKLYKRWPELAKTGPVGDLDPALEPSPWARTQLTLGLVGTFHNAQLPHRMMPLLIHKVLQVRKRPLPDGSALSRPFLAGKKTPHP